MWKKSQAPTLEDIDQLINKGKWRKARKKLKTQKSRYGNQARYWFMLGLLQLLLGDSESATRAQAEARSRDGYSVEMEGDFLRDCALFMIRRKRTIKAYELLRQAEPYHTTNERKGVLKMCYGRRHYADGLPYIAKNAFEEADQLLSNKQWKMNNRFHWMKSLATIEHDFDEKAREIIESDPSRKRRLRARFIRTFGRLGNAIDDTIASLLHL